MKPKSFSSLTSKNPTPQVATPLAAALFLTLTFSASGAPFTAGNLAVLQAAASANNTTFSVVEINSTSGGSVQSLAIDGATLPGALRFSGSATSTGYLTTSQDGSLLAFAGHNAITTGSNANTLTARGVGVFDPSGTFSLATTYTGSSGNQARGATTLDNTNWFIADQGGLYTNGTSSANPSGNLRAVKSFGGSVYAAQASNTTTVIQVATISAPTGGTITGLPGLSNNSAIQDFQLIQSGDNGSTYDVLYVVSSTSNTVGTISKYSLVGGTWVANGSHPTTFGGFGLTAKDSGNGAKLYVSTGLGALTANSVLETTDTAGYNSQISITTANNVTLYTAPTGTIVKGVAFAPVGGSPPVGTVSISSTTVNEGNGGTSVLSLTVTRTNTASAFAVNYAVTGGTATSGSDFVEVTPGTLNFTAGGAASQTIDITVNGDTDVEVNEFVELTLSGIVDGVGVTTLGTATAKGIIVNDDSVASSFPATGALTSTLKGHITLTGAEIPAFDPLSKRAFTSTGTGIQVVDLTDPALPVFLNNIAPSTLGISGLTSDDISSIAVRKGVGSEPSVLAAGIISSPKTNPGYVVFLNAATGALLGSAQVGAVPDHIAFTPDGTKLLVANEGELDGSAVDISADTVIGSVSIIDISSGVATPVVTTADFTSYDAPATITALKDAGVRIFQGGKPSTDFEPEYLAISADGTKAMVTLQEANAVAVLDIASATFTSVVPLGKKDFSSGRHDFSDRDGPGASNLVNLTTGNPVFGLYMPDAIASFSSGGQTYYVTANEGDDRNDFLTPDESTTVGNAGYDLDNTEFPNESALKNQASLGRLTVSNAPGLRGDMDGDGDIDEILSYGGRSFSILDSTGALVFDSGDMIENIIASQFPSNFDDGRSDNKGPEPEGVTIANLGGRTYAFVGLERSHMVLAFDVTNPLAVTFTGGFKRTPGDLNPEGLVVVSAEDSPSGKPLLLVASEVSNTLTIHELTIDPFATWLAYNGYTSNGIDSDTDNDGLTDRVEFYFNQNPNNGGDFGNMPKLVSNGGALELDFTRLTDTGSITGGFEVSNDLNTWTPALLGVDYTVASSVVSGDETAFTYALPGTGPSAPGVSPVYLTPNSSDPAGATLGGIRVVNEGLVGVGRIDGDSLDEFGETQGAASGLFITDWRLDAGQLKGTFNVLPDRGFNSDGIFSNYAARLHRVTFDFTPYYGAGPVAQGQIDPTYVSSTKFTYDDNGTIKFTTGLDVTGTGTLLGQSVGIVNAANGPLGAEESLLSFDAEAVHLFDDGSGFVSDEYGTYIVRFDANKRITGITQLPESARPHNPVGTSNFSSTVTPANGRRQNQGLEGMSVTPDGTRLFALMQSALVQDTNGGAQQTRNHTRLFVYDVAGSNRETPVLIGQYVVMLPQFNFTGSGGAANRTAAQSEIVALNGTSFLMLPRDGNGMGTGTTNPIVFKSVQLVDFASATNILGTYDAEGAAVSPTGVLADGVNAAASAEIINMIEPLDLAKFGLNANTNPSNSNTINEKMEGMALVPDLSTPQENDFFLFLANDNDFQSSDVKMIDASGNFMTGPMGAIIDGRLNAGITNDAMFYAYRITIDADGKKFFRFEVK